MAAADLDIDLYGYKTRPASLVNSIFMYTVNMAAKTLVSVARSSKTEKTADKWKTRDHLRFMFMTWLTVWVLRVLMDHLPVITSSSSQYYQLEGFSSVGLLDSLSSSPSSSSSLSLPIAILWFFFTGFSYL